MKTIELTRRQLVDLYNLMIKTKDKIVTPKVAYFFIRNIDILQPEINAIQKAADTVKLTPELEEYNKKQQELHDELGDTSEYLEKSQNLFKENMEIINAYRVKEKEFNLFIEEKVEINLAQISFDDIPENIFTVDDFTTIVPLLKETQEELDEKIF